MLTIHLILNKYFLFGPRSEFFSKHLSEECLRINVLTFHLIRKSFRQVLIHVCNVTKGGASEAKKPPSKQNNKKHGFCFFSDKRLKYQTVSCLITFTVNHAACPADPQSRLKKEEKLISWLSDSIGSCRAK